MNQTEWYLQLIRPDWAPPAWVFGSVWAVLYTVIALTFGYVGYLFIRRKIPFGVALPFILNLFFNLIFTPIQFGLKNNLLAAVDILLVLGTLLWAMHAIKNYSKWVVIANFPYLFWVLFATTLQLTITYLNL